MPPPPSLNNTFEQLSIHGIGLSNSRRQNILLPQPQPVHRTKNLKLNEIDELEMDSELSSELALKIMDQRFETQFTDWIKDEANVDYIVHHLKRIVPDYPVNVLANGFRFLLRDWSVNSCANLLIKLFYEFGLDDEKFGLLMNKLCSGQKWSDIVDLLSTLMIGEPPKVMALFLQRVTIDWDAEHERELIVELCKKGRWGDDTLENVLTFYTKKPSRYYQKKKI